jgi:hypothetical protein
LKLSSIRPLGAIARDEFFHEIAMAAVSDTGAEMES